MKNEKLSNFLNNSTDVGRLLTVVVFITILSQAPFMQSFAFPRYICYGAWAMLFVYIILKQHALDFVIPYGYLIVTGVYVLFLTIATLAFNVDYWKSHGILSYFTSLGIFFISIAVGKYLNDKDLCLIARSIAIASIIFTVNVFLRYLTEVDYDSYSYAYNQKNTAGMLVLVGMIFIVAVEFRNVNIVGKIIYAIVLVFMTITIFRLRSRAVLASGLLSVVVIILFGGKTNKVARIVALLFVVAFILLLMDDYYYDLFINKVLYNNRASDDIYAISAGRSEEWENFGKEMQYNFFFGQAYNKQESFYLMTLIELGALMGTVIICYAISPFVFCIFKIDFKNNPYALLFLLLCVCFVGNGFFEALPPIGSGVKCFTYWMYYGIFYSMQSRNDEFSKSCVLKRARGFGA